jgi:hypothetical protein
MALQALNGVHPHDLADSDEPLSERLYIALSPTMLRAVEDHFYGQRHKNMSDAARSLLALGLLAQGWRKAKPDA